MDQQTIMQLAAASGWTTRIERDWSADGETEIETRIYSPVRFVPVFDAFEFLHNNPARKPLCCFYAGMRCERVR
jgi:hypothetical protein